MGAGSGPGEPDVYFKKVVSLRHQGQALHFRVAQALFSSFEVDAGTRLLLKSLAATRQDAIRRVLDLGCGYGPIGLALKKADDSRLVHMVDRDALAVEYARQNAELNQLSGVEVYGSVGYHDVSAREFDLIACNVPGKAGEAAVRHLLLDAAHFLNPSGVVTIVVVAALESAVAEILAAPNVEVVFRQKGSGHVVFHYRFREGGGGSGQPPESALERGVFDRMQATVDFRGMRYPLTTAYGLPEFDSPSFKSALLIEAFQAMQDATVSGAAVFNPGQGHVPVAMWKLLAPGSIRLVDRDLLGLRYSRANLLLNECPTENVALSHQAGLRAGEAEQVDLVAGVLREEEGIEGVWRTVAQAAEQLSSDGTILLAGTSTAASRLIKRLNTEKILRVAQRKRRRGNALLVLGR